MKYINMIVAAFMGISFALAAPSLAKDSIQGPAGNHTMVDTKWEVPISADRTDAVTGTVQDVIRHLEVVAPETLEANNVSLAGPGTEPTDVPLPFHGPLVKTPAPKDVNCKILQTPAYARDIKDGIKYLKGLSGKASIDPQSCSRVSCSWGSAIVWCNDNSDSFTLDGWSMVADGAQAVLDNCGDDHGRVRGESVYDGGWRVQVYINKC